MDTEKTTRPISLRTAGTGLTFGGRERNRAAAPPAEGLTYALRPPTAERVTAAAMAFDDRGLRLVASGGAIL